MRTIAAASTTAERRAHAAVRNREIAAPATLVRVSIKSHHNVGGRPERMHIRLVEPLREMFKDEVRALGPPEAFIGRHPFPRAGLAIRCPCEITQDNLDILGLAD